MSGSTIVVYGAPGAAGQDGIPPGGSGLPGSSGNSVDPAINPGNDAANSATAYGGVGGAGGNGAEGYSGDGGSGAAGGRGGDANATVVTLNNSTTGASSTASATSGNGGNAGVPGASDALGGRYGGGANGAAAGSASATAQATDLDGSATSNATAFGEAGGLGSSGRTAGNGGRGGSAGGVASATGLGANAELVVTTGSGGGGAGEGAVSGNGGASTGASVSAVSKNAEAASANLTVNGGNGGNGQFGVTGEGGVGGSAAGGNGTAISLDNDVKGSTVGGTLYLYQSAVGGSGGDSDGDLSGDGAGAKSKINLTDSTSANITTVAEAQGGYGGASTDGGAGAQATAVDDTTAVGSVGTEVVANGGGGGGSEDNTANDGTAEPGATVIATTIATTAGLTTNASAVAETGGGDGGYNEGGNDGGAGASVKGTFAEATGVGGSIYAQVDETAGAGGTAQVANGGIAGVATGATAIAVAKGAGDATASLTEQGGTGGSSNGAGAGAPGGSENVSNAVSGSTLGGTLSFTQVAVGGAGGSSGGGPAGEGGDATSKLTNKDKTSTLINANMISDGGGGGYSSSGTLPGGTGGTAVASLNETASSPAGGALEVSVTADGGAGGGSNGGVGSTGGAASATDIAQSRGAGYIYASADASGGAGGYGYNGLTNGVGGKASASTNAIGRNRSAAQTVSASASATGGGEGLGSPSDAAASAAASAMTGYGQLATAKATAMGTSGIAEAQASTSGGILSSLVATARAPTGGNGSATAEADEGTAITSNDETGAYALVGGLARFQNFGPNVGSVFNSVATRQLTTGALGASYEDNTTGAATFRSSLTVNIKPGLLPQSDTLYLGLMDGVLEGRGFTTLDFEAVENGTTVIDKAFSSISQANSFLYDDLVNLGTLPATDQALSVTISVTETLAGIGDGYETDLMIGAGKAAVVSTSFKENHAATTGSFRGDYIWSDVANWSNVVPTAGSVVKMPGVGIDDIAGLSLARLSVSPLPGDTGTEGKLTVEADLTVATLVVAASSEIDVVDTSLTVTGASTVDGLISTDPSTITYEGAVTGTGTIDVSAGCDVIFDGPVAATVTVDYLSTTGTLTIGDPSQFDAQVIGSGTEVVICYLRGTRVLTPAGEVPIESLARGDRLVTRFGAVQAIKWIGRQSFAAGFIARNRAQWPVRIAAGALGHARPTRDLFVSPGHSMLIEDRLILARNLVNGVTITQSEPTDDIHYYQVEFEGQDCILAEGAWSESYADDEGLRNQFHNVDEFWALFPTYKPPAEPKLCAFRPESGLALEAALKPIVARAGAGLAPGPLRGFIDTIEHGRVSGWAQDMAHPELPVLLDIWLGDQFLGTVLACDFRSDLKQAGIGRGYCSFRFVTPVSIPAASLRLLTVTRITDGSALQMTSHLRSLLSDRFSALEAGLSALHPQSDLALVTSRKRILCGTTAGLAPGHLRGFIDSVENDRISGWAQDVSYPELPVLLDIWLYDQLLGTILACAYRGDLDAAGIGRGCCSFSFATQLAVPVASLRYLTIRRRADGATLQMTPELRTKAA